MNSHHYDGTVIFVPSSETEYFSTYSKTFPDERFLLYSYEETEACFQFDYGPDALDYLRTKGLESYLPYVVSMTGNSYRNEELQRLKPIVDEMLGEGMLRRKQDPREIFCGKVLIIRGYYSGQRLSEILQDLPNISVNWDFGRALLREEPVEVTPVSSMEEILNYLENLPKSGLFLRYEGKRELPSELSALPRLTGPYVPKDASVIYIDEGYVPTYPPQLLSDSSMAELHLETNAQKESRRLADEAYFLRASGLLFHFFLK